jgi:predicted transcriptional regulator
MMKTVVLEVRSLEETLADAAERMESGEADQCERISFSSPELLWEVLNADRWRLLKALCGAGPVSVPEAAERTGREIEQVDKDVQALAAAGILNRPTSTHFEFPYEAIKVEFLLEAA